MTKFLEREKARAMRARGKSYSEIKDAIGIGKGTLSVWLRDMPLTSEQIRNLRDLSPRRIENYRATVQKRKNARLDVAMAQVRRDIGKLTRRDLFIGGLYLYWGEGMRSQQGTVGLANTDPAVIRSFLKWLTLMKVPEDKVWFRLHLYVDMDIKKETKFWADILNISTTRFRKPYVKKSALAGLTYKNGHGHGTCNVLFGRRSFWEYISMALKYIREDSMRP